MSGLRHMRPDDLIGDQAGSAGAPAFGTVRLIRSQPFPVPAEQTKADVLSSRDCGSMAPAP